MIELRPDPLDAEQFAPFGDVIEASETHREGMNDARFERFDDLARVATDADGEPTISIARCRAPTDLPYEFNVIERHPLGSQAFVPLAPLQFIVVVAPAGDDIDASQLRAFVTNGRQGINYHRGTWHMPLIGLEAGQEFLVVDRTGDSPNCELHTLDDTVRLLAD